MMESAHLPPRGARAPSGQRSKSKIRTLLEALDAHGTMDAEDLRERTGLRRDLIVATMYCARDRGMVDITPRDRKAIRERGVTTGQRTRWGQLYTFRSYETVQPAKDFQPPEDPWGEPERQVYTSFCMPNITVLLSYLDRHSRVRQIRAP